MTVDPDPPQRLPRGRHGLSRDEVVQSQRGRIFMAMAETTAEQGYARTSVAEVLRRAGVSRETFYEQFSSKEDCFMSALEASVGVIFAGALEPEAAKAAPMERFSRGLRSYLDALAENPSFARMFLIESYAAGPAAVQRRTLLQQRYADTINDVLGHRSREDRFAFEALIAAIIGMVTARLASDDVEGLQALHAPVMKLARELHAGTTRGIGEQRRSQA